MSFAKHYSVGIRNYYGSFHKNYNLLTAQTELQNYKNYAD